MGKMSRLGNALYEGDVSIDFVGRKWLWYSISGVIVLLAVAGLYFKGLNFGIEFEGGVEYTVSLPANQVNQDNVDEIRTAVADTGIDAASQPIVNTSGQSIRVQTEVLNTKEALQVTDAIAKAVDVDAGDDISTQDVGASWGEQVAKRALTGLVVFLVLVVLFIWAYFREWKMSVGALVALAHDIVITIGVYALSGFEVTPATVTGLLTILGFSLYDTVVVFDKVQREHQEPAPEPSDLCPAGQPRGQPDPGPLDQHLDRRPAAGRCAAVRRHVHPGLGCAQGPGAGTLRRHGGGHLLLDLHRDPARGPAEVRREGDHRAGRPGASPSAPRRRPLRQRPLLHRGPAAA